jgi:hypothetical protein
MVAFLVLFYFLKTALLTYLQYYAWTGAEAGKMFLPPHQPWSYFALYSWTHFWFSFVLTIGMPVLFWLLLRGISKHREGLFADGEIKSALVLGLVVGWPNFLIFVPLTFIFFALLALFRKFFLDEEFSAIFWPMLTATVITAIWGSKLIDLLHLEMWRI